MRGQSRDTASRGAQSRERAGAISRTYTNIDDGSVRSGNSPSIHPMSSFGGDAVKPLTQAEILKMPANQLSEE